MPLVRVQLSSAVDDQDGIKAELSKAVAQALGKPESYMMVVLEPGTSMLMGGSADPAALVEVRSVGTISPDQTSALSGALSQIVAKTGIDANRVYCNFTGIPGNMWGMGDRTFG
jgi:phenylpyruvate tautomerase PptA (4-oxalocrotonate tautomerase family)